MKETSATAPTIGNSFLSRTCICLYLFAIDWIEKHNGPEKKWNPEENVDTIGWAGIFRDQALLSHSQQQIQNGRQL